MLFENRWQLETVKKYYRIDRREICFLKFILEGYEGLALLSTCNSEEGIVVLKVPPGCEAEANCLMQALQKEIMIEERRPPAT